MIMTSIIQIILLSLVFGVTFGVLTLLDKKISNFYTVRLTLHSKTDDFAKIIETALHRKEDKKCT